MASLFQRKDSPYWWIKKKNAKGDWVAKSTKYSIHDPLETKKARSEVYGATSKELDEAGAKPTDRWSNWVKKFLETHVKGATLTGYLESWFWLDSYLSHRGVTVPAQVTFQDAFDFIAWRRKNGRKEVTKDSTALKDLKVLRILMRHAVRSGMAKGNPCDRMGIKKPAPSEKLEFTDAAIKLIYKHLPKQLPWLQWGIPLSMATGCRVSDIDPRRIRINTENNSLTFLEPKGGKMRAFTTLLPVGLAERFEALKEKYGLQALIPPKGASQRVRAFFKRIGLEGYSMHCTRVTILTRLTRAGVSERAQRLVVNHASETSRRVYLRNRKDEGLQEAEGKVKLPQPPAIVPHTSD